MLNRELVSLLSKDDIHSSKLTEEFMLHQGVCQHRYILTRPNEIGILGWKDPVCLNCLMSLPLEWRKLASIDSDNITIMPFRQDLVDYLCARILEYQVTHPLGDNLRRWLELKPVDMVPLVPSMTVVRRPDLVMPSAPVVDHVRLTRDEYECLTKYASFGASEVDEDGECQDYYSAIHAIEQRNPELKSSQKKD